MKFGQIEPKVVKLKLEPKTAVKNRRNLSIAAAGVNVTSSELDVQFLREQKYFKPGKMVKLNQNTTKTNFHNNRNRVGVSGVRVDLRPKIAGQQLNKINNKK